MRHPRTKSSIVQACPPAFFFMGHKWSETGPKAMKTIFAIVNNTASNPVRVATLSSGTSLCKPHE